MNSSPPTASASCSRPAPAARARWVVAGGLLALLALAAAIYRPGLSGDFIFDDFPSIAANSALLFDSGDFAAWRRAVLSGTAGWGGRPLAMLSFAVDAALHGLDPYWFKLTNLFIHLGNVLLVFVLTQRLLGMVRPAVVEPRAGPFVALAVAAFWGLHPLQLTGVLYVVQRMTSLSAMFVLLALVAYLWLRQSLRDGRRGGALAAAALAVSSGLAAVCAKESALLLPLFCLSLEIVVAGDSSPARRRRRGLMLLALTLLPVLAFFALNGWDALQNQYRYRNFTATERLLTEARVLWHYLGWLLVPDAGRMGLHHDDIALSRGLLDPPTTLAALCGLGGLLALAWCKRRSAPWFAGCLLFFLGGHLIESTLVPLDIAYEHRNYLPGYGIILCCTILVCRTLAHRPLWLVGLGLASALSLATITHARATVWGDPARHVVSEAARHPLSPRANYHAGRAYWTAMQEPGVDRESLRRQASAYFHAALRADPCNLSGGLALLATEVDTLSLEGEILPLLNARIERCAISRHDADLLAFAMRCAASGLCVAGSGPLRELARRFAASERLVPQGRELLDAAKEDILAAGRGGKR